MQKRDQIFRKVLAIDNVKTLVGIHTGKKIPVLKDLKDVVKRKEQAELIGELIRQHGDHDLSLWFMYFVMFPNGEEDPIEILKWVGAAALSVPVTKKQSILAQEQKKTSVNRKRKPARQQEKSLHTDGKNPLLLLASVASDTEPVKKRSRRSSTSRVQSETRR
jgi:hypothetical protein